MRFSVGDALALDGPDGSFDAVRSEPTLQWLADPEAAIAEMARVLRPGGRIALIDTDWSTLLLDVGDDALAAMVHASVQTERARPPNVGRWLSALVRSAGFGGVAETSATHVWTKWHRDPSPAPAGCFSMTSLADGLVSAGELDAAETATFVATICEAARQNRFSMPSRCSPWSRPRTRPCRRHR